MVVSAVRKMRRSIRGQTKRMNWDLAGVAGRASATALWFFLALGVSAAGPPSLRVEADAPLAVTGSGFRPQESVEVSIVMGARRFGTSAVVSDAGGFTVRFTETRLNRCATPLAITAKGSHTGVVTADLPVRECAAP
jgi:hypothetical protein